MDELSAHQLENMITLFQENGYKFLGLTKIFGSKILSGDNEFIHFENTITHDSLVLSGEGAVYTVESPRYRFTHLIPYLFPEEILNGI